MQQIAKCVINYTCAINYIKDDRSSVVVEKNEKCAEDSNTIIIYLHFVPSLCPVMKMIYGRLTCAQWQNNLFKTRDASASVRHVHYELLITY